MKETESGNFKYTQKNIIIGNKMRSIIIIDEKPDAKLGQDKIVNTSHKTVSIKKRKCGGCSRKRRG